MATTSRIPGLKEGTIMGSRLPGPKVRRRLPSTPPMVNGGRTDCGDYDDHDKRQQSESSKLLHNGVGIPAQNLVPPTCPPRMKKLAQGNAETGILKPKESSGIPGFSSPSNRLSPAGHSEVRKTFGRSVSEKSDTSSSSQTRLRQSSTEDMRSQEYNNSVSSSENRIKDTPEQNRPSGRSFGQTRSSLVETIRSSLNKSADELQESNAPTSLVNKNSVSKIGGLNMRGNYKTNLKNLSTEVSKTDNSTKPTSQLRSRSYSKERLKSPSAAKTSRVSSAERGRVNVRRQVVRSANVDSDSSECDPSAPRSRTPRSSLPISSSSRKSSLPRHVASKRSVLSRSSSSQSDDVYKRDSSAHFKQPISDTLHQDKAHQNNASADHQVRLGRHGEAIQKQKYPTVKCGQYGSSEQIDSGINSSKDSDMPVPDVKVDQTSISGTVQSFNVVKLTDSMLSVYEIQEGDDGSQNEKKSHEQISATNNLCSTSKAKDQVETSVNRDYRNTSSVNSEEVDSEKTWFRNEHGRPRTYSGGSMLLPSESNQELNVDDMLKSQQRHSWGEDCDNYVSNMPVTLNTWHGPDSDSSTLPSKHNLVSTLDSSGMSYASSGDSESDKPHDGSMSQGNRQLKSYLSTSLSQAKTQSPTRRQIRVQRLQTQENKNDSKPPLMFTSRMRPNSPSTRSPLLVIKPQMIRRNSFKERAAQERPLVKKKENRPRSPVLATPGDRSSIASDTSESRAGKDSPRGSKIQNLASLFQGGRSRDDDLSVNSPRRTSSRESSPAQFSDESAGPKLPPKLTSPRNRSPVLAFPIGRNSSSPSRKTSKPVTESESESDVAPALPPRRTSSPNNSLNSNVSSKKTSSLPVSRENSPGGKLFNGTNKQNTNSRDNSPLSMLLSNNRKIQEANSMVFTPVRQNSTTSSAPSTPTHETEQNDRNIWTGKHTDREQGETEGTQKEHAQLQPEGPVNQGQSKSVSSRGSSPVRGSHIASFIAKLNVPKAYMKRSSSNDSEMENTEPPKEEIPSTERPSLLYQSRNRIGGSRGSSPVSEKPKIVPPRRPRSSPPVIVYKTPSDDDEVSQRFRQGGATARQKSGIIPPRVTSPARSQETMRSGLVSPRIGSPARGQSPSAGTPPKTFDSKTGIKVLAKSSKLPFFMAQDKKPPLGRSLSKESKASSEESKTDSSFLLQVINRQDNVGDSDSSVGRDSQSSRKKSGILKPASDDSDGSDYSYGKGGRDSPSKKRVTFDKHIMEKEAKRELREARLKAELARFVVERKKQEAISKYSVDESELEFHNSNNNERGGDSWEESVADDLSDYFSETQNQEDSIKELEKYIMLARQQRENINQVPEDGGRETPLYSEIDKSKKSSRLNRSSELDTSASDQELVFEDRTTMQTMGSEIEGDYVKLSDLDCVMRSDSRNRSPYLSDSADRGVHCTGETDLDHINLDLYETDESDHQGTTRPLRPGEVNGVDYTFLSPEDFEVLEKSGSLLESGTYDRYKYGTPMPSKEPQQSITRSSSMGAVITGPQPAPRRKRNRSIGESVMNKGDYPDGTPTEPSPPSLPTTTASPSLGPLPSNWEMAYTEDGTPYFIDHVTQRTQWQDPRFSPRYRPLLPPPRPPHLYTKPFYNSHSTETTHWLDPRLAKNQKTSALECREGELPYGWEKVEDPHYGTYFIDHVNRKTQYENPVSQAKRIAYDDVGKDQGSGGEKKSNDINGNMSSSSGTTAITSPNRPVFTKDVDQLRGEFLKTQLTKSSKGFGFTILGGNEPDEQFLQIKHVAEGGPAFSDGQLSPADVLVYVRGQCVLGFSHSDVVRLFQSINVGEKVIIEVCRGYALPYDPDTEIRTTVAVTSPHDSRIKNSPPAYPTESRKSQKTPPHGHLDNNVSQLQGTSRPEILRVNIVKGALGFGFTIADSAYGQRVRQILDSDRCKTLEKGDILLEINHRNVKDMPHSEVVSVLKECRQGEESMISVQRGGMLLPSKNRKTHGHSPQPTDDQSKGRSTDAGVPRSTFFSNDEMEGGSLDEGFNNREGARLNESQDSGNPRPEASDKPPDLVPFRNKTPTTDVGRGRSRSPGAGLAYDRTRPVGGGGVGGTSRQNGYSDSSTPNNPPPPPPPGKGGELSSSRSFGPADRQADSSNLPTSTRHRSRTPGPEFMRGGRGDDQAFARSAREVPRSKTPTFMHSSLSGTPDFIPASQYQSSNSSGGGSSVGGGARGPHIQEVVVTAAAGRNYNRHNKERAPPPPPTHDSTGTNNSNPEMVLLNHSKSHNITTPPVPTAPNQGPPSYATSTNTTNHQFSSAADQLKATARKQSTSFEYVEPRPSNLMRIPKLERTLGVVGGDQRGGGDALNRSRSPFEEERFVELTVQLEKQESGFGFRIIGGTEEGSQVSVGHIVPSGAADQDGGLKPGDEIIEVDGHLVLGSSHHKVVQLMGQAAVAGTVTLTVRRRLGQGIDQGPRADTNYPYEVTVTRREMEGFGFVIISSVTKAGSVIELHSNNRSREEWMMNMRRPHPRVGRIIEGSPAERCGCLHVGDRILAVNGTNITHSHHEDIVNLIKESGYSVSLTVGPPQDDASSTTSHNSQRSSGQGSVINPMSYPAHSESDLSRRSDYSPHHNPVQQQILDKHKELARQRAHSSSQQASPSSIPEEDRFYQVELHRGSRGFGFSIRGGREFNNMPLFVLKVAHGGTADVDKRLRVGDQIMEINGCSTTNMTHAEAIDLIQNGGSTVKVLVKHTGKLPPQFGSTSSTSSNTGIPVRTTTPTLTLPNGPITGGNPVGPLSQSSPNPNRRPPETNYFQSNFPRY